jgi:hypothetical protein
VLPQPFWSILVDEGLLPVIKLRLLVWQAQFCPL